MSNSASFLLLKFSSSSPESLKSQVQKLRQMAHHQAENAEALIQQGSWPLAEAYFSFNYQQVTCNTLANQETMLPHPVIAEDKIGMQTLKIDKKVPSLQAFALRANKPAAKYNKCESPNCPMGTFAAEVTSYRCPNCLTNHHGLGNLCWFSKEERKTITEQNNMRWHYDPYEMDRAEIFRELYGNEIDARAEIREPKGNKKLCPKCRENRKASLHWAWNPEHLELIGKSASEGKK